MTGVCSDHIMAMKGFPYGFVVGVVDPLPDDVLLSVPVVGLQPHILSITIRKF